MGYKTESNERKKPTHRHRRWKGCYQREGGLGAEKRPYTILYAVTYNIIAKVTLTTATNHTTLDSMVTSISKLYNVLNACLVYCLVVICFQFVCFL